MRNSLLLIVCLLALSACAYSPVNPQLTASEKARLDNGRYPFSDEHLFTNALRNLGRQINSVPGKRLVIMIHPLNNKTGSKELPFNITEEVEASLNLLAGINLKVMPFDPQFRYLLGLGTLPTTPTFYVRGAITRFDKDLEMRASDREINLLFGGGKWQTGFDMGFQRELSLSAVSTVFHLTAMQSGLILPGLSRANTVQVFKMEAKNEAGFAIYGNGAGVEGRLAINQGLHQGVKNLIDYSILQLFSGYYNYPYWLDLGRGTADANVLTSLVKEFKQQNRYRQVKEIQVLLQQAFPYGLISNRTGGKIKVTADGKLGPVTKIFLNAFAQDHSLTVSPHDLEEIYRNLLIYFNPS